MTRDKTLGISMLGCGTVGLPLLRTLSRHENRFQIRTIVVGDPGQEKYDELRSIKTVNLISSADYDASNGKPILEDEETDIVVEVIGGSKNDQGQDPFEKTRDRLLAAIRAGKHVVTANKTVISFYGPEVFKAADQSNVNVLFEAAVAGSIPIIQLLKDYWNGQPIRKVMGILNGTCNYILSRMDQFGAADAPMPDPELLGKKKSRSDYSLEQNGAMCWALDHAQVEGLAEADPSFDVDGHDSAQKLAIMASIIFDSFVAPTEECIPRSSILPVTLEDINLAEGLGFVIKPLAIAERQDDSVELRVHPCLIPKKHPLANVSDAFNAVYIESEEEEGITKGFGHQLYLGQGAGGDATATALFSNVMELSSRIDRNRVDNPQYYLSDNHLRIVPGDEQAAPGYIKSNSQDIPGIFMRKTKILYGENEDERINIHQIYNLLELQKNDLVPDVITIWPKEYRYVKKALDKFVEEGVAEQSPLYLRIEE